MLIIYICFREPALFGNTLFRYVIILYKNARLFTEIRRLSYEVFVLSRMNSYWLGLSIGSKMKVFILLLSLAIITAAGSLLDAALPPERPQPATRDAVMAAQSKALMSFFF